MTKLKEEQIFIQIDNDVIELTGQDKKDFIAEREAAQIIVANVEAEIKARKEAKISAYTKLGLTEKEINAIL